MEQHDTMDMLELLIRPAFCVENGVVVRTNKAAQNRMIEVGSPISALLLTGQQEYTEFSGGCLYLTLTVAGTVQEASVVRMTPYDVFLLEEDTDHAQLRAMALAAQNLREPLSSTLHCSQTTSAVIIFVVLAIRLRTSAFFSIKMRPVWASIRIAFCALMAPTLPG